MTTVSQESRYRSGYAAGQRAAFDTSTEHDAPQRPLTGDDWADVGYAHGFDAGTRVARAHTFADFTSRLKGALGVPRIIGSGKHGNRHTTGTS